MLAADIGWTLPDWTPSVSGSKLSERDGFYLEICPSVPNRSIPAEVARDGEPEITAKESAVMLRAAFQLFKLWRLSEEEEASLLGHPSGMTMSHWRQGNMTNIPYDTSRRLSYLMGIHMALRRIFKDRKQAYGWIRRANDVFGGQSALERMLGGDVVEIAAVRSYLRAELGGGG